MKYFKEAKYIWKNYVPKSGQADTVEGELIRAIERLRYEAQNNGNCNWDEGFELFCHYLWEILNDEESFEHDVLLEIKKDIDTLLNFDKPYLDDDVYDRISDHIIEWTFTQKGPIKREKDSKQYR